MKKYKICLPSTNTSSEIFEDPPSSWIRKYAACKININVVQDLRNFNKLLKVIWVTTKIPSH